MINLQELEKKIQILFQNTMKEIVNILDNKPNPDIFINLNVEKQKLGNISSITSISNNTICIKPFLKENVKLIEGVVLKTPGYSYKINNDSIYAEILPPYQDVLKQKQKQVGEKKEEALIKIRKIRQDNLQIIKQQKKNVSENLIKKTEKDLQKIIDDYSSKIKNL